MPRQSTSAASDRDSDRRIFATLVGLSTATISTVLLQAGLRNIWIRTARPIHPNTGRIAGRAFTMRFVPAREDLSTTESLASPHSTRGAVEQMPAGCVAVVDAMGINDVGIAGDILCARMKRRGVAALVTDGAMRDVAGVRETGLPVWCNGIAAPPSVAGLTFVGWEQPIGCGGVAVFPGDIVVVDDDGALVIPDAFLETVLKVASEKERMESWILDQVNGGRGLLGLYPPDQQTLDEYQAWRKSSR